ncbi:MAG TPA: Gfo/Idh/MocA family oxidoreductase [Spirochaetia bacterium]|nr:Gfo/Idh/MocA family oxidoreductase [Spirochaetia bacterium]
MPKVHRIGIIMNGVTGRMGMNQHLLRSILPIIEAGGVKIGNDELILPDPLLVGRNAAKLERLSRSTGIEKFTTDLDTAFSDPDYRLYFDAQTTLLRSESVRKAVAAGKDIYCEKPTGVSTQEAYDLYKIAQEAGVKHGVVQDKLWLPGIMKVADLIATGFFGRILSVRGEFGYWVFEGDAVQAQRPSWNYKRDEGGGIIFDMLCHWRYLLDNVFGRVKSLTCLGAVHIPQRWDETGSRYEADAEDSAYSTFELDGGIVAHFNSSWDVRVRRDDLLTLQIDGTRGSAVAGLRECWVQPLGATPKPVWNPDIPQPIDFYEHWTKVPEQRDYQNAFKVQWELFLRHLVSGGDFPWNLLAGAEGVQLAELGMQSWKERRWLDVPPLERLETLGPAKGRR